MAKINTRPIFLLLTSIFLAGCATASLPPIVESDETASNIILFIGDGLGDAQRTAARWKHVGQTGKLAMDDMSFYGEIVTQSSNRKITDSAAAATAMATGIKTKNGIIGLDKRLNSISSILEYANNRKKSTGLVTTTQLTHATPAAFVAHVNHRNKVLEIGKQIAAADVNVLLGGGEDDFIPATETGCYVGQGKRSDYRNLISEMSADTYTYVCERDSLNSLDPASVSHVIGLFADEGMQRPFSPLLSEMTRKAISILSQNPEGFFLMVEGGQIDWAGHDHDAENMINDTIGFDKAVAVGLDYSKDHPDTLVIVTADHETGGMLVDLVSSGSPDEDGPFEMPDGTLFFVNWTKEAHSAKDVPLTASGPGAYLLKGRYQNTRIYAVMRAVMR